MLTYEKIKKARDAMEGVVPPEPVPVWWDGKVVLPPPKPTPREVLQQVTGIKLK